MAVMTDLQHLSAVTNANNAVTTSPLVQLRRVRKYCPGRPDQPDHF